MQSCGAALALPCGASGRVRTSRPTIAGHIPAAAVLQSSPDIASSQPWSRPSLPLDNPPARLLNDLRYATIGQSVASDTTGHSPSAGRISTHNIAGSTAAAAPPEAAAAQPSSSTPLTLRPAQLTAAIKRSASIPELLDICGQHEPAMNDVHRCAALVRLVRLQEEAPSTSGSTAQGGLSGPANHRGRRPPGPQQRERRRGGQHAPAAASWKLLAYRLAVQLRASAAASALQARGISNAMWGVAKLQLGLPLSWWQAMTAAMRRCADAGGDGRAGSAASAVSGRDVSNAVYALSAALGEPGARLSGLAPSSRNAGAAAAQQSGDSSDSNGLAGAAPAQAPAAAAAAASQLCGELLSLATAERLAGCKPQELSSMLYAMGRLRHRPPAAWWEHTCAPALLAVLPKSGPQALANALWALQALSLRPGAQLCAELLERSREAMVAAVGSSGSALQGAGGGSGGGAYEPQAHVQPDILATMVWSVGRLDLCPSATWMEACTAACRAYCRAQRFGPRSLASVYSGLSLLRCRPSAGLVADLFDAAFGMCGLQRTMAAGHPMASSSDLYMQPAAAAASAQDVAAVLAACQQLQLQPPPRLMAALLQLLQRRLEGGADGGSSSSCGRALAVSLWALAKLNYQPSKECMDAFVRATRQQLHSLAPGQLTQLLWAYAALGIRPTMRGLDARIKKAVAELASGGAGGGSSGGMLLRHAPQLLWSLRRLKVRLRPHARRRLAEGLAQALSNPVQPTSAGTEGGPGAARAAAEQALSRQGAAARFAAVVSGLAGIGLHARHGAALQRVLWRCGQRTLRHMQPRHLCAYLAGCRHMGYELPPRLALAIMEQLAASGLTHWQPTDLAGLAHELAHLMAPWPHSRQAARQARLTRSSSRRLRLRAGRRAARRPAAAADDPRVTSRMAELLGPLLRQALPPALPGLSCGRTALLLASLRRMGQPADEDLMSALYEATAVDPLSMAGAPLHELAALTYHVASSSGPPSLQPPSAWLDALARRTALLLDHAAATGGLPAALSVLTGMHGAAARADWARSLLEQCLLPAAYATCTKAMPQSPIPSITCILDALLALAPPQPGGGTSALPEPLWQAVYRSSGRQMQYMLLSPSGRAQAARAVAGGGSRQRLAGCSGPDLVAMAYALARHGAVRPPPEWVEVLLQAVGATLEELGARECADLCVALVRLGHVPGGSWLQQLLMRVELHKALTDKSEHDLLSAAWLGLSRMREDRVRLSRQAAGQHVGQRQQQHQAEQVPPEQRQSQPTSQRPPHDHQRQEGQQRRV